VEQLKTRYIIGADGARSNVAKAEIPDSDKIPYVIAYHEIIEAPSAPIMYDPKRCDVIYDGTISPDFYGWVFPHGESASVGMGTGHHGFDLKTATSELRSRAGLDKCKTIRKEGAPIVLHLSKPARLLSSDVAVFRSKPWCPVPIPTDALSPCGNTQP
jgi:geranylgeranyl reductase